MSAGTAEPAAALRRLRVDVADLVVRAREGQARAVARLISLVEDASPQLREVAAALAPYAGSAQVIGLTGPPGVGKCRPRTAGAGWAARCTSPGSPGCAELPWRRYRKLFGGIRDRDAHHAAHSIVAGATHVARVRVCCGGLCAPLYWPTAGSSAARRETSSVCLWCCVVAVSGPTGSSTRPQVALVTPAKEAYQAATAVARPT